MLSYGNNKLTHQTAKQYGVYRCIDKYQIKHVMFLEQINEFRS